MNGFEIGKDFEQHLKYRYKKGVTILELGSGEGTQRLSEHFNMISVEQDEKYLDLYDSNYIHARINKNTHWFEREDLLPILAMRYDIILIDAPRAIPETARLGFLDNLDLFNMTLPIYIDDVHRNSEFQLAVRLSYILNKQFTIFGQVDKMFAEII